MPSRRHPVTATCSSVNGFRCRALSVRTAGTTAREQAPGALPCGAGAGAMLYSPGRDTSRRNAPCAAHVSARRPQFPIPSEPSRRGADGQRPYATSTWGAPASAPPARWKGGTRNLRTPRRTSSYRGKARRSVSRASHSRLVNGRQRRQPRRRLRDATRATARRLSFPRSRARGMLR